MGGTREHTELMRCTQADSSRQGGSHNDFTWSMCMQIRKLITAVTLSGAFAVGTLAAVGPANAAVTPGGRTAPAQVSTAPAARWIHNSSYHTENACDAEGQFIVGDFPDYTDWICLPGDGMYQLWLLYDPN